MATNKERIENLESRMNDMRDGLQQLEKGMTDKFSYLESSLTRLTDVILASKESVMQGSHDRASSSQPVREESDGGRQIYSSKMAKLEFPRYYGEDPTEWLNKVGQFFEFQGTVEDQKVSLASFHLEGEANQWWQWLSRNYKDENRIITWRTFMEELWARFGPTECEDFDEALSRVRQSGTLRDYQKEFERLGNRVQGWTQKALVGTFMGGLKPEISESIRMFRPKTLKEAISLARMKDEQLARQRKFVRTLPTSRTMPALPQPVRMNPNSPIKRLSWEEMQKRRAQGLCFNCDEKFTVGHKCQGPQILLLEGNSNIMSLSVKR